MTTKSCFLSEDKAIARVFNAEELAAWQRLAPARDVAALLIHYRLDHELSQRGLAERLGVSQPFIAKLESAEHLPTLETLSRVAGLLGRELRLTVRPPEAAAAQRTPSVALSVARRRTKTTRATPPANPAD